MNILKIKSLHIKNFKSIVDLTINEPNPFTVFVGPNGSGKSNIFEALEFFNLAKTQNVVELFGGKDEISNFNIHEEELEVGFYFGVENSIFKSRATIIKNGHLFKDLVRVSNFRVKDDDIDKLWVKFREYHEKQLTNFHRIFIKKNEIEKQKIISDNFLSLSASNLEKVLKRLLENEEKREEISEWLELFLPEFDRIEVQKSEFSSNENLLIYQKHYERPFNKELISDGTYNIIALLTAVYQSNEPQFLCIEEPENGLNPYVIRKLVDFFRNACAEKGHYIWLNTHSQTLVECLQPEEVIVVDKINGETQIKQIKGMNLHGLDMAEVWLSGALGGGTPW